MNEKIQEGTHEDRSFDASSFDASLSEDDSEDEDDFVTFQEFDEYQQKTEEKLAQMTKACNGAIEQNIRLMKKIDKVDWGVVASSEKKLTHILGEFQLSVDGLLLTIEADLKRWKCQHSELL